jgi:hypothetical protein
VMPCSITSTPTVTSVSNGTTSTFDAPSGPFTYSWTITGNGTITSGATSQSVVVLAGNTCASYTLSLTLTLGGSTSTCSQTVTVTDNQPPTFTLPPKFIAPTFSANFCVENIYEGVYLHDPVEPDDPADNDLTYLRPDYYLFEKGFPDLNLPSYSDNCTLTGNLVISWTIDFADGTTSLSGTGQLGDYNSPLLVFPDRPVRGIKFPVGTNKITYRVTDATGLYLEQTVFLVVDPRPTITKNF